MARIRRGHPGKVEVDSLDRGVAAGDHVVLGVVGVEAWPDGSVILTRNHRVPGCGQAREDAAQQLAFPEASNLHSSISIARRRRAACSGSGASASARIAQTRRSHSAVSWATFASSMPPIANTGTATEAVTAFTPAGPMTPFSFFTGVAKAGPLPT